MPQIYEAKSDIIERDMDSLKIRAGDINLPFSAMD